VLPSHGTFWGFGAFGAGGFGFFILGIFSCIPRGLFFFKKYPFDIFDDLGFIGCSTTF